MTREKVLIRTFVSSMYECNSIYNVDVRRAVSKYKSLLISTSVSTRHLRSWLAKQKMSEDDFSETIGRNMHLHGTVMH